MSRALAAGVAAAVADQNIRAAILTHFEFDSGAVRFWTGIGELVWGGDTFAGSGNLGTIGVVEETTEVKATGLTFTLSGVSSSLIATALDEDYQGRACTCWVAYFDASWVLIADPVQIFAGLMDTMVLLDDGSKASIAVTAENRLVDLERPNNVLYMTNEDQQFLFPGDKGLEYVPEMQEVVLTWGRADFVPGNAPGGEGTTPASGGSHPGQVIDGGEDSSVSDGTVGPESGGNLSNEDASPSLA